MRSGVGWCFMELFVVCIHINNVTNKNRKKKENRLTHSFPPPTVDIIQNSCGQFVQTNDL